MAEDKREDHRRKEERRKNRETQDQFSVPPKVTLRYCAHNVKTVMDLFVNALLQNGLDRAKVDESLERIRPALKEAIIKINDDCITGITNFQRRKTMEDRRKDYFGRALLYRLENYFPNDEETTKLILAAYVEDTLPRQIAEGLIKAIKSAQGDEQIEKYESRCKEIKEKYRKEPGNLIDIDDFVADEEVKQMVEEATGKFRNIIMGKSEEEQKNMLFGMISRTESFNKMQRDLTENEFKHIMKVLF